MENQEFEARVAEIKKRVHGRWGDLLPQLGVDEKILSKRNQPCPMCGGHDRFQYTDKFGEGNYHCRGCGAGGGFKLLRGILGWDFGTILARLEDHVGQAPAPTRNQTLAGPSSADKMKRLAKQIWDEAHPIVEGDEVDRYLRNRGLFLVQYPRVMRFHSGLGYYEKDSAGKSCKVAEYPAMLACIQGADGHAITLHRTYLKDGAKALINDAKKVLSAGVNGGAIRLFDADTELALAEGIETALAVHLCTGQRVWSTINAGNMEKLWIPETIRRVCIYADNDANASFDGQASAFCLARRLRKERRKTGPVHVEVFVPKRPGADWAEVWNRRIADLRHSA